jgi:hypothetical protein
VFGSRGGLLPHSSLFTWLHNKLSHGFPTCGQQDCIMRLVATFLSYVYICTIKITCPSQWLRSLRRESAAGIAGSNPAGGMDVCLL